MSTRFMVVATIAVTGSVVLLFSAPLAGTVGLVVTALLASAVALGAFRARLSADVLPESPPPPRSWPMKPFHAYREIEFALGWGRAGRMLRPVLARVATAIVAQRRGIDADRDPDAARRLLGEHAWVVADPGTGEPDARPLADIARFVDRLEQL